MTWTGTRGKYEIDKLIQYECAIIHVRGVKVWFQLLKSNMGKNEKEKFRFKV